VISDVAGVGNVSYRTDPLQWALSDIIKTLQSAVIAYQKLKINNDVSKLGDTDTCIALGSLPDEYITILLRGS